MQEIGIESSVLNDILEGKKTIEGRLGKPRFLKIREGDRLSVREDIWQDGTVIESLPDMATLEVTQVLYFESFAEMFEALDFKQALPRAKSEREAIAAYRTFYSEQDEAEYGVVAFEFVLQ